MFRFPRTSNSSTEERHTIQQEKLGLTVGSAFYVLLNALVAIEAEIEEMSQQQR
jgi:hypothetical protein